MLYVHRCTFLPFYYVAKLTDEETNDKIYREPTIGNDSHAFDYHHVEFFFIVRIAPPGGPFASERKLPEVVERNINAKYHLDEPLIQQYGRYMFDILRGDLGPSFKYKDYDVNYYIANSLPKSVVLGSYAMLLALVFGISAGIMAAVRQNTWLDYLSMGGVASSVSRYRCSS